MAFIKTVREPIAENDLQTGLDALVKDGIFSQIVAALSGGVLLVGFALELGASNLTIGLLASVPFIAQLAQIPAIALIERLRLRRAIAMTAIALSRLLLFPIAMLPMLGQGGPLPLALMVAALASSAALGAVAGCSWNSWMHDLVPERMLGSFFARRLFFATAFAMLTGLGGGFFVEWWGKLYPDGRAYGYSLLFLAAIAVGLLSTWQLSKVPEPRMADPERRIDLMHMLSEPFRNRNFRRLILFLGWWNFAVNLAAPFFTVYLISQLHYDIAFVTILTVVSQVANMIMLRLWGRLADRFSNKTVLSVCTPLFLLCILAWTFTAIPEKHALTAPLLFLIHVVMGLTSAGITLAAGNIGLKLAPQGRSTAYLAAGSLITALASGIAPIIGGLFADDFAARQMSVVLRFANGGEATEFITMQLRHWDFFFLLAFVLGLFALHRLSLVREEGEVHEKILLQELVAEARRSMHNLSPVAGLRVLGAFPFGQVLMAARRKRLRPR